MNKYTVYGFVRMFCSGECGVMSSDILVIII